MMCIRKFLWFVVSCFLGCLPFSLPAQMASFYADTAMFYRERETRKDIYDKIMETEWRINGQVLHYGSSPVSVEHGTGMFDTILYKQRKRDDWDTILCLIKKTGNYTFVYNDCCGAFYIRDETKKFIQPSVVFRIKTRDAHATYLGTLGEAGILVNTSGKDTLRPGCRSPMSPNVYPVTLNKIEICKDTLTCMEGTCLYEPHKKEFNDRFGYTTQSQVLHFLFMPLGDGLLEIVYDSKTGKVHLK